MMQQGQKIRVLVVDDSAFMRKRIREILESDPQIEVIGVARNGEDAVAETKRLRPDVVTLDVNMPVMDGLTALQIIMAESPCPVVMLSSLTQEGAVTTFEALELGAVDYIPKPSGTVSLDIDKQAAEIVEKVKAAARARLRPAGVVTSSTVRSPVPRKTAVGRTTGAARRRGASGARGGVPVVAIGVSTGGPKTLMEILPYLPGDLPAAVLIVQHMPAAFTGPFAQRLDQHCQISVKEAKAGDPVLPGRGYVAPGGWHMVLNRQTSGEFSIRLTRFPSDALHIPSVDVMMYSVAKLACPDAVGVLLTGMGDDGAAAMLEIRRAGGRTIAESEETAIVFGMPARAIELGAAEQVLPSYEIASAIVEMVDEIATARRTAAWC